MDLNPDGQFVGLVIIHSITAFGASKGYKMISSLIKTYQDLFPPPSDRDTISLLSCSGEKMCLKRRICEIFMRNMMRILPRIIIMMPIGRDEDELLGSIKELPPL